MFTNTRTRAITSAFRLSLVILLSLGPRVWGQELEETGPLSLGQALVLASEFNPILRAKRKELGIVQGDLRQASTYFQNNPVLSFQLGNRHTASSKETETTLSADIGKLPGSFLSGNRSVTSTESNDTTDWGIGLSQELEVFGQPRARRNAFASARDSVVAEIATVEWDVLARVRVQFYAAQVARLKLELAEEQYDFATSVLDLSRQRFEAGDISRLDFRQIEIQTASLKTNLFTARGQLQASLGSLRLTLGVSDRNPIRFSEMIPPIRRLLSPQEKIVDEILDVHPLLKHARLVTEQRQYEYTLTEKEAKPNITASLAFEREGQKDGSSILSFGIPDGFSLGRSSQNSRQDVFSVGISVPIRVFNRGKGNIAAARSRLEVASAEASAATKAVSGRAGIALEGIALSYESAALYSEEIFPNILAYLAQLESAFRQGELNLIELRVNQRDLLEAQSAGLESFEEYYRWRAEVEGLLGRDLFPGANRQSEKHEL